jgi:hypothetical protein
MALVSIMANMDACDATYYLCVMHPLRYLDVYAAASSRRL